MDEKTRARLARYMDGTGISKLEAIECPRVHEKIAQFLDLCRPDSAFVCTDSEEDVDFIRKSAIANHEEIELKTPGHTVHFDGYFDQARDKLRTWFLLEKGDSLGPEINSTDRQKGLNDIREIMTGIMAGKTAYIRFFALGPLNSPFTIPCLQITDSAYVAHSEDLLYRNGYDEFVRQGRDARFFLFVHSAGELEEAGLGLRVSRNVDRRRVYIDLYEETIYSANTQYGGNTIGLKKLAMRLAIARASREGWLTEHMFVMGIHGPNGRKSYFTGAYPSMCGKTSTAMMNGESIVGDDIAYLRIVDGRVRAVNVERGIFGIIDGINSRDDPLQWKALNEPHEIIFSNVLVTDDMVPYWNGKDGEVPEHGVNYAGEWYPGKKGPDGVEVTPSHKNARFTIDMASLPNTDERLHDPLGVEVAGIIYGGRDSDTSVPVEEAFDWEHGVVMKGACLESETTAATLGKVGVRVFNPMSNLDFLSIPIGQYIQNNLDFGKRAEVRPRIFSVNYFLRDKDGKWLNHKNDKAVWLKWMELRVNGDVRAKRAPTGYIPLFEDLERLFSEVLGKVYTREDYVKQFTVRIPENLSKVARMRTIFRERVLDTPETLFRVLDRQEERLIALQRDMGQYVSPEDLPAE